MVSRACWSTEPCSYNHNDTDSTSCPIGDFTGAHLWIISIWCLLLGQGRILDAWPFICFKPDLLLHCLKSCSLIGIWTVSGWHRINTNQNESIRRQVLPVPGGWCPDNDWIWPAKLHEPHICKRSSGKSSSSCWRSHYGTLGHRPYTTDHQLCISWIDLQRHHPNDPAAGWARHHLAAWQNRNGQE